MYSVRQLQLRVNPKIDAVLLDLTFGPGHGWRIFDRLASVRPRLPVIILTATRREEVPFAPRGYVALMENPLDLPLLFQILRKVTGAPEPVLQN